MDQDAEDLSQGVARYPKFLSETSLSKLFPGWYLTLDQSSAENVRCSFDQIGTWTPVLARR